ncbi:von Willebrand factor-like isoform X2 [Hyla sarda]|uniref:von Willebrand factor-like isoform X2 n=1 Tax=Hyla sarda TaxID=327740 RepID=UPI0024C3A48F|nr:von Willebrand factor-like isoform X2 [Hyla sarda]XP_056398786.1 von Willebrand factor-like isoform X2 [Hyla sarda]
MTPISLLLLGSLSAAFILVSAYKLPPTTPAIDCGPDKVFKDCGTACPLNCTHTKPVPCIKICKSGCFCKEGLVELEDSCVEKEKCESCTGNTTYTGCGTTCLTTCRSRPDEPIRCTAQCYIGCQCKPGYVLLDEEKKICVLPEDCPKD